MKKRIPILIASFCLCIGVAILPQASASSQSKKPAPSGLPDLVVREDVLRNHWLVRDEELAADSCTVEEGGITPGEHKLVRFTVTTPNIGTGDLVVGDPNEHVAANDGLFEFAPCHHHFHFRHYALYELVDPATGHVWRAAKRGFCMIDFHPNPQWLGGPVPGPGKFFSCGSPDGTPGNQGITAGWSDTYDLHLDGQFFVLDGGDGQPVVPAGTYLIRITVNPPFVAAPGEPCPFVDSQGFCHQLPESDFTNNVSQVTINIPSRAGRTGVGPEAGNPHLQGVTMR